MNVSVNKDPRDIILKPVVSEKSYGLIDEGKYTFLVDPRSSKTEIKLAIEKIFGVKDAAMLLRPNTVAGLTDFMPWISGR